MTGFFRTLLVSLITLGLLGGLLYFVTREFAFTPEKGPAIFGKVVRSDLVQRISFAGTITTRRQSIITAPYSGYIRDLYVQVGKKVKKGDPLVSIAASLDSFEEVHPLRAPFAGLVTLVRKSEGEFTKDNDSQDYILRIDDVSKFFVEAKIPEIDRTKIELGQEALIKVSAISNIPLKGVVKRVSLAPDEKQQGFSFGGKAQVEYPVFIEITEGDDRIKAGMSAIIDVIAASLKNVLVLGHEFVQSENEKYFVTLKDGSKREVKIGLRNDEAVEIVEGLEEGVEVQQIEFAQ